MIENSRQNHRLRGLSDFTDSLALRVLRAGARISFLATLIFALPAFASTPLLNLRQAPSVEEESYQKEISESLHLTDQTQNDAAGVRVAKNGGALSLTINQNYSEKQNNAYKHVFIGTQRLVTKLVVSNTKKLEDVQWYYSGDHLSSTSYVTNADGDIVEHLAYFPYGETWVQEKSSLPIDFGFTAKELDEETGYYYFGARYYDPRVSTWVSTDPALGHYLPASKQLHDDGFNFNPASLEGMGGIYNSRNLGLNIFVHQNPVRYTDPDGRFVETVWDAASLGMGISELVDSIRDPNQTKGDVAAASLAVTADLLATAIPFVPGGAGAALKGTRAAGKLIDAGKAAKTVEKVNDVMHGHHAFPKYLGGATKQALEKLPSKLHNAYHAGLDKIAPRSKGTEYYKNMSPNARKQLMEKVGDYTKAFDKKHGTNLMDAMKREGFE